MRKLGILLILCVSMFVCSGCDDVIKQVEGEEATSKVQGISLHKISDILWYDDATYIVYLWNGYDDNTWATMPSAYLAPNGLPYRYNKDTKELEEIDNTTGGATDARNEDTE